MTDYKNGSSNNNNNNNNNNNLASRLQVPRDGQQPQETQSPPPRYEDIPPRQRVAPTAAAATTAAAETAAAETATATATTTTKSELKHPTKKKRRDKSDLGDDFVAPDGGWGWVVAVASGVNILVTFALAQQFGVIFRDHMPSLNISKTQVATIINIQIAVSAFTGLLNGPLFRRYTYRAVALVGSVLTFVGLFWMVFADTFIIYVLSFSITYGFGRGLTVSASSLAVNTYFKVKRRAATAYQFGVAGLGPIICPLFANHMVKTLGVQETTAIFAAVSLHTIACSLVYQPVKWHVVKRNKDAEAQEPEKTQAHLEDEDEDIIKSVVEPDTPVLPRANDGWFGSRASLNSAGTRNRLNSWDKQSGAGHLELKRLNSRDSSSGRQQRSISISHSIKEEPHDHDDDAAVEYAYDKDLRQQELPLKPALELTAKEQQQLEDEEEQERRKKLPFYKKIVIFFDLNLLTDITYVNLAMGITLINFVEINFAIMTPYILADLGFNLDETAFAMSLLGFFDLIVRFLIPLITGFFSWSNRTFFVVGILGMCFGRVLLSMTSSFYVMTAIFLWLGLNKAFRTVFWSLIIPSYVPLKRLPAAAGLQLLMSGTFSIVFGPLLGVISQATSHAFLLNCLNALCVIAIGCWYLEDFIRARRRKSPPVTETDLK